MLKSLRHAGTILTVTFFYLTLNTFFQPLFGGDVFKQRQPAFGDIYGDPLKDWFNIRATNWCAADHVNRGNICCCCFCLWCSQYEYNIYYIFMDMSFDFSTNIRTPTDHH